VRIERDAFVARTVRDRLFRPSPSERRYIGAEVELIALLASSGRVCPVSSESGPSSLGLLRAFGASRAWREERSAKGVPRFVTPDGVVVTFEPGGQIEFASPPCASVNELLAVLHGVIDPLRDAAHRFGVELHSRGIDPLNNILEVPLQLDAERYVRMSSFFESVGPSGARMMRQTAAVQVSVDGGDDPARRWRFLADVAPYLTAIFANSRRYAGVDAGLQSYRAYCWRTLDTTRTGVPPNDGDPRAAYLDFALDALDMMRRDEDGRFLSYRAWMARGEWTPDGWEAHLTTLFPEVRPRGHLEVRSMDVVAPQHLAAPLVLIAGLTYHEATARRVRELLSSADDTLLWRAAGAGLRDTALCGVARALVKLGLEGAKALGRDYVSSAALATAEHFFDRYTMRGLAPADEAVASAPSKRAPLPRLVVVTPTFDYGTPA
jgi:glutamate--cysteine ligase